MHIINGRWWKRDGNYVHASPELLHFVQENNMIESYFGLVSSTAREPNTVKLLPKTKQRAPLKWGETLAYNAEDPLPFPRLQLEKLQYRACVSFVGRHGDLIRVGTCIIAQKVSRIMV